MGIRICKADKIQRKCMWKSIWIWWWTSKK